ncbi:MFS transporter [Vogesella oryzae]|uniref:MFS transporter n=1 Tax=Vogesella oryzae TaxID=1735285 RepID=UPI0015826297|nr:MFS transporter [Vogesella oryzae]
MNYTFSDKGLLAVIMLAIFVVPGSISGTAVALPTIGLETHASLAHLQWVVNAFNLTFACFTLVWGALADAFGRKRCFLIGAALYSLASLLSGLVAVPLLLDLARGLAGIGAAAIFSCGIAILSTHFAGGARMRAFAVFGTVAGLGVSLGPTISGLILENFGWRAIFWGHATALALVLLGASFIPHDARHRPASAPFDVAGAVLFILALLALMTAIVQGAQWGWESRGVMVLLVVSGALLAVFCWQEHRLARPMLELSLLRNREFVGMALVTVAASFGFVTLLTYLPGYLGGVLRQAPGQIGLTMLLLTLPMLLCPLLAGRLVRLGISPNRILHGSMFCLLAGVVMLAAESHANAPLWQLAVPLLLVGSGMGLSAGLVDGLALKAVPAEQAGMAAGLLNTFRLGSEAIAVALYGSLLATLLSERLRIPLALFTEDTSRLHGWIEHAAAGNLGASVYAVGADKAAQLQNLLVAGYDGAFHGVLWVLACILIVLTFLSIWLTRKHNEQGEVLPSPQ